MSDVVLQQLQEMREPTENNKSFRRKRVSAEPGKSMTSADVLNDESDENDEMNDSNSSDSSDSSSSETEEHSADVSSENEENKMQTACKVSCQA